MVLKIGIDRELEWKFRECAMKKYGYKKGAIKQASKEMFSQWLKQQEKPRISAAKDPLKAMRGCMKHLRGKYTSVELQHEAQKLWLQQG